MQKFREIRAYIFLVIPFLFENKLPTQIFNLMVEKKLEIWVKYQFSSDISTTLDQM